MNKHRMDSLPKSKKFLSMMDISVVPIKRKVLNDRRGKPRKFIALVRIRS